MLWTLPAKPAKIYGSGDDNAGEPAQVGSTQKAGGRSFGWHWLCWRT
jgi:hypothetical protein